MEEKFYGMYMNDPHNKHKERAEEKQKKIEDYKKPGLSVQGMAKTQLETVKVQKSPLFPHKCSLYFELTVECPRLTQQKRLASTTSQTRGPG